MFRDNGTCGTTTVNVFPKSNLPVLLRYWLGPCVTSGSFCPVKKVKSTFIDRSKRRIFDNRFYSCVDDVQNRYDFRSIGQRRPPCDGRNTRRRSTAENSRDRSKYKSTYTARYVYITILSPLRTKTNITRRRQDVWKSREIESESSERYNINLSTRVYYSAVLGPYTRYFTV